MVVCMTLLNLHVYKESELNDYCNDVIVYKMHGRCVGQRFVLCLFVYDSMVLHGNLSVKVFLFV